MTVIVNIKQIFSPSVLNTPDAEFFWATLYT